MKQQCLFASTHPGIFGSERPRSEAGLSGIGAFFGDSSQRGHHQRAGKGSCCSAHPPSRPDGGIVRWGWEDVSSVFSRGAVQSWSSSWWNKLLTESLRIVTGAWHSLLTLGLNVLPIVAVSLRQCNHQLTVSPSHSRTCLQQCLGIHWSVLLRVQPADLSQQHHAKVLDKFLDKIHGIHTWNQLLTQSDWDILCVCCGCGNSVQANLVSIFKAHLQGFWSAGWCAVRTAPWFLLMIIQLIPTYSRFTKCFDLRVTGIKYRLMTTQLCSWITNCCHFVWDFRYTDKQLKLSHMMSRDTRVAASVVWCIRLASRFSPGNSHFYDRPSQAQHCQSFCYQAKDVVAWPEQGAFVSPSRWWFVNPTAHMIFFQDCQDIMLCRSARQIFAWIEAEIKS